MPRSGENSRWTRADEIAVISPELGCVLLSEIRWIILGGVVATSIVPMFLRQEFSPLTVAAMLGISFYGLTVWVLSRVMLRYGAFTARWARWIVGVAIGVDSLALGVLLYFIGGLQSPLASYYVLYVTIASVALSRAQAYLQALVVAGILSTLFVLQRASLLPATNYQQEHWELGYLIVLATMAYAIVRVVRWTIGKRRDPSARKEGLGQRATDVGRANDELVQRDGAHWEFITIVAHDLRAPLAAIEGYLEALQGGFAGPVYEQQRAVIARCCQRLAGLRRFVGELLDVGVIESGRLMQEMVTVDLAAVAGAALEIAQPLAAEKGIVLQADLRGQASVLGCADRLEQVLNNLLTNAVKFTPAGGKVDLRVVDGIGEVVVEVIDDGPGIAPGEVERVFDGQFGRRPGDEGAGLGLYIARRIVEAHGGRIWAESPFPVGSDRGSRFAIALPKAGEPSASEA